MTFHSKLNINKQIFVILKNHLDSEIFRTQQKWTKDRKREIAVDQTEEKNCKKKVKSPQKLTKL